MQAYYCHTITKPLLKYRLYDTINVFDYAYNEPFYINDVKISFHPAGHIPGSAQIRIEYKGEVWCISGDYKVTNDNVSAPFESVECDVFVTECTFGAPKYVFPEQQQVYTEINEWWENNAKQGVTSVIMAYSLGKAQRIINNVNQYLGPIITHASVERMNEVLRKNKVFVAPTIEIKNASKALVQQSLVVAPTAIQDSRWIKKLEPYKLAFASGWMLHDTKWRWQGIDKGFALSDHCDWNELLYAIKLSKAKKIIAMHGDTSEFVQRLRILGFDAHELHETSKSWKLNQMNLDLK
jgi:putative mRNA 3-end processing factor